MTALVQAISRYRTAKAETEIDMLKTVALFCGAGLAISLVCVSYGVDLSQCFF